MGEAVGSAPRLCVGGSEARQHGAACAQSIPRVQSKPSLRAHGHYTHNAQTLLEALARSSGC